MDTSEAASSQSAAERGAGPAPGDPSAGCPVILFDGVCTMCSASVKWVIRRDRKQRFRFASLQSEFARAALARLAPGAALPDSIVLLESGRVRTRSDAAIRIARLLGFPWCLGAAFRVVPPVLRDALYSWVARHRYKWFGKQDACMVPTPALRARFLDASEGGRPTEHRLGTRGGGSGASA